MNVLLLIALFAGVAIASANDYGNGTSSSTGVDSVASEEENEPKSDAATANVVPVVGDGAKLGSFNIDDIENRSEPKGKGKGGNEHEPAPGAEHPEKTSSKEGEECEEEKKEQEGGNGAEGEH